MLDATGARSAAGRDDAAHLPAAPDVVLDHGDSVAVGATTLDVVHLRGHTPGSVALILRAGDGSTHAFTGDSLFPGGVGNTEKDPQRFSSLLADVEERLFGVLPDDTWVYPGHGEGHHARSRAALPRARGASEAGDRGAPFRCRLSPPVRRTTAAAASPGHRPSAGAGTPSSAPW